jgi:hypothetical protein
MRREGGPSAAQAEEQAVGLGERELLSVLTIPVDDVCQRAKGTQLQHKTNTREKRVRERRGEDQEGGW